MWYRSSYYGGDQKSLLAPYTKDMVEKAAQRKELDAALSANLAQVKQLLLRTSDKLVFERDNPHSRKPDFKNNCVTLLPVQNFSKMGFGQTAQEAESLRHTVETVASRLFEHAHEPFTNADKQLNRSKTAKELLRTTFVKEMHKQNEKTREVEQSIRAELTRMKTCLVEKEREIARHEGTIYRNLQEMRIREDEICRLNEVIKEETAIPVLPFGLRSTCPAGFKPTKKTNQALRQQAKAFVIMYKAYKQECEDEKERMREGWETAKMDAQDYHSRPPKIVEKTVVEYKDRSRSSKCVSSGDGSGLILEGDEDHTSEEEGSFSGDDMSNSEIPLSPASTGHSEYSGGLSSQPQAMLSEQLGDDETGFANSSLTGQSSLELGINGDPSAQGSMEKSKNGSRRASNVSATGEEDAKKHGRAKKKKIASEIGSISSLLVF